MDYYEVRRKLEKKMGNTSSRGEIDLFETALFAIDTQIPKQVKETKDGLECSSCESKLDYDLKFSPYCRYCGQMLEV